MTWFLDVRALPVGGDVAADVQVWEDAAPATIGALAATAHGRHVLFGTHGFNVNREYGRASLSEWETLLSLPAPSLFVGVLWPGDARTVRVLDYPFEDAVASRCGRMLGPYIDRSFAGSASISFVSHSLGARVVLETVRAMAGPVRELALMAGAIDDNCLTGQYRSDLMRVGAISVLASVRD